MKIIRTVDTFAWHCKQYYGVQVDPPKSTLKKTKPRQFDPTNWKNNDLYMLLGLQDKRHEATFDEIRASYRAAVLLHHPDKQAQRFNAEDDSLFKCLQKAFMVLSDAERRQQYDSIDFDESIPRNKEYLEEEFWQVFPEVFYRNSRFSTKQPVPMLCRQMSRDEVDEFYSFWFNFESWRRFEFLDEEDTMEGGERAEKRYIEKKNKAARQKRKTEDNARISRLVELAYKHDPRIKHWKNEDKKQKELKKQQQQQAKASKPTTTSSPLQRSSPSPDRKKQEEQVKLAMAAANESKIQKKAFRTIFKDNNYFTLDLKEMERVALMMEQAIIKLSTMELKELGQKLIADSQLAIKLLETAVAPEAKHTIPTTKEPVLQVNEEQQKQQQQQQHQTDHAWTNDQIDQLIKAVKAFPPGVANRWLRITEHLNKTFQVSHESVLKKVEDMKAGKMETEGLTTDTTVPVPKKRDPRVDESQPTILIRDNIPNAAVESSVVWSSEEQGALEAAMKTFGADTPDRWAKVAQMLPGRTKQDVIRRVKEIADKLKSTKK